MSGDGANINSIHLSCSFSLIEEWCKLKDGETKNSTIKRRGDARPTMLQATRRKDVCHLDILGSCIGFLQDGYRAEIKIVKEEISENVESSQQSLSNSPKLRKRATVSSPSAVREINNSSSDGSEEGDNTHVSHGKPDSSQGLSHSTDLSGSDVESYKVSGVQTTLRPSPSSFHIQSLHLINEFKAKAMSCVCSICKLFCKTEQELTDHMIRRHNVQVRDLVTVSNIPDSKGSYVSLLGGEKTKKLSETPGGAKSLLNPIQTQESKRCDQVQEDKSNTSNRCKSPVKTNQRMPSPQPRYSLDQSGPKNSEGNSKAMHVKEVCELKQNSYQCRVCGKVMQNKRGISCHMRMTHKIKIKFTAKGIVNVSQKDAYGPQHYCNICGMAFKVKKRLENHFKLKHDGSQKPIDHKDHFQCNVCKKYFKYKGYLKQHMIYKHGKSSKARGIPLKHAVSGALQHRCTMCYKSFQHAIVLRNHVLKFHGLTKIRNPNTTESHASTPTPETSDDAAQQPTYDKTSPMVASGSSPGSTAGASAETSKRTRLSPDASPGPSTEAASIKSRSPKTARKSTSGKIVVNFPGEQPRLGHECKVCGKVILYGKRFKTHMRNMHGGSTKTDARFVCGICPFVTKYRKVLFTHMQRTHAKLPPPANIKQEMPSSEDTE